MPDRGALLAAVALYLVFLECLLAPLGGWVGVWGAGFALAPMALKLLPDARLVYHAARRLQVPFSASAFLAVWSGQLAYGLLVPWFGTFGRVRWKEPG